MNNPTPHPHALPPSPPQGAPESILARCSAVLANHGEGVVPLTDAARASLAGATRRFGRRALRTLALAYKPLPAGTKAVGGAAVWWGRGLRRWE